jgi:hypothetical protein
MSYAHQFSREGSLCMREAEIARLGIRASTVAIKVGRCLETAADI